MQTIIFKTVFPFQMICLLHKNIPILLGADTKWEALLQLELLNMYLRIT